MGQIGRIMINTRIYRYVSCKRMRLTRRLISWKRTSRFHMRVDLLAVVGYTTEERCNAPTASPTNNNTMHIKNIRCTCLESPRGNGLFSRCGATTFALQIVADAE